jgi:hypothetical protein
LFPSEKRVRIGNGFFGGMQKPALGWAVGGLRDGRFRVPGLAFGPGTGRRAADNGSRLPCFGFAVAENRKQRAGLDSSAGKATTFSGQRSPE